MSFVCTASPPHDCACATATSKLIEVLMALLQALEARPISHVSSPAHRTARVTPCRPLACSYCSDPAHLIRHCPTVPADISAGICRRNIQGKVVLPSGLFVPPRVEGQNLRARIYHRRFPTSPASDVVSSDSFTPETPPSLPCIDDIHSPAYTCDLESFLPFLQAPKAAELVADSHSSHIASQPSAAFITTAGIAAVEPEPLLPRNTPFTQSIAHAFRCRIRVVVYIHFTRVSIAAAFAFVTHVARDVSHRASARRNGEFIPHPSRSTHPVPRTHITPRRISAPITA
ncbi:hypothetical protein B0H13DRAFT_2315977 [Mycena leptocephala]|nr:hypothetical protein B0H13DRAFT_2315977 [Mycena leptocephala]